MSTPRYLGTKYVFSYEHSFYEKKEKDNKEFLVATNVVASRPPKGQPTGTPTRSLVPISHIYLVLTLTSYVRKHFQDYPLVVIFTKHTTLLLTSGLHPPLLLIYVYLGKDSLIQQVLKITTFTAFPRSFPLHSGSVKKNMQSFYVPHDPM